jgi:phytoene synthase
MRASDEFAPPPGSDTHYALLYVPDALRGPLALVEAFRGQLVSAPLLASDPVVTMAKLTWWGEELGRLAAGGPRHALTQALAPLVAADATLLPALDALVAGIAGGLHGAGHADDAERHAAFDAAHGALWEYVARRCGAADTNAARHLGVRLEIAYALRDLRRQVEAGSVPVPRDILTSAGVVSFTGGADAPLARAVAADLAACRGAITNALAALPRAERRRLLPLVTLARITLALLAEIERDGCQVWDRRLELPPLRKLWLAWRTRFIG